jgi:hypothetical protein
MKQTQWIIIGGLLAGIALLGACGDSEPPPSKYNRVLGDSAVGAPLGPIAPDPGILENPTNYNPTPVEATPGIRAAGAGDGGGAAATAAGGGGGDLDDVRTLAQFLVNTIRDGDVDIALRAFNADDIAAISEDDIDRMYATFETIGDGLGFLLEERLGVQRARNLLSHLYGTVDLELRVEILDAQHATVAPRLTTVLFGPQVGGDTMIVEKRDGAWQFHFDAPLTAEQVQQIAAYHERLQEQINRIIDWIYDSESIDEAALTAALEQAGQGEEVNLGAGGAADEQTEDAAAETP